MSDNAPPGDKIVKNPLFSASVTGVTVEEFSQNALLMPAQVVPTPEPPKDQPTAQILPQTSSGQQDQHSYQPADFNYYNQNTQIFNPTETNLSQAQPSVYSQEPIEISSHFQPEPQQTHSNSSHFSSVFSTFSNILNFSNPAPVKQPTPPPPSSIENLIGVGYQATEPVPLFSPGDFRNTSANANPYDQPNFALNSTSQSLLQPGPSKSPSTSNNFNPVSSNFNPVSSNFNPVSSNFNPISTQLNPISTSFNPLNPQATNLNTNFVPPPLPKNVNPSQINVNPSPINVNPSPINVSPPLININPSATNVNPSQINFSSTPVNLDGPQTSISPPLTNIGSATTNSNLPANFQPPPTNFNPPPTNFNPPPTNFNPLPTNFNPPPTNFNPLPTNFNPLPTNLNPPPANLNPPLAQSNPNTYRRAGIKKPIYAQIPGLTSGPNQFQPHHQPTNTIPTSFLKPEPQTNPSPIHHSHSSPALGSTLNSTPFLQPVDDISIKSTGLNFFQNQEHSTFSSSIMAAVPDSEISQPEAMISNAANSMSFANANLQSQTGANTSNQIYRPAYHHWFHKKVVETKTIWTPFSMADSLVLESAFTSTDSSPDDVVPTDGGRYDVNILRRQRVPVYWKGEPNEVRRCSWFHKGSEDGRYSPYEENVATKLENEYKIAFESNQWNRKVELANGNTLVFHGPDVLVLFPPSPGPDGWGNTTAQPRPRIVKRGVDDFDIDEGESETVDHLLFMVHGIGSVCDLKFRTVEEVVDEFRSISLQLVRSHYRTSCDQGSANRVEVLPISWHSQLHSEDTGIDKILKSITLESIPKLREFANDTLLDILFYSSPVYCQTIVSTVGNELNRIFELFKQRNPKFSGCVSLGGHSLGSLILFDLLCHQHPEPEEKSPEGDVDVIGPLPEKTNTKQRRISRRISYMMSNIGTGQAQIYYPHLNFQPVTFFALGSPIGMFVTVRGLDQLGEQFALPTCPGFINIFHPYDPVAYRIESLINSQLANLKPVLIPHHKGRKRMHLELKETMARVGADLKQKVIDSMKNTWNSFYQFSLFNRSTNPPNLEEQVDKVIEEELDKEQRKQDAESENQALENLPSDVSLGLLNKGRRVDYVLQEAPFEFFNEYLFALTSHCCYWESEDTILLILKEIYNSMGVKTDSQTPQQTMTIERLSSSPKSQRADFGSEVEGTRTIGMDPTMPIISRADLAPPPISGFVRKS